MRSWRSAGGGCCVCSCDWARETTFDTVAAVVSVSTTATKMRSVFMGMALMWGSYVGAGKLGSQEAVNEWESVVRVRLCILSATEAPPDLICLATS